MANCSKPCESIGNGWPFSYTNPAFLLGDHPTACARPIPLTAFVLPSIWSSPAYIKHRHIAKVVITEKYMASIVLLKEPGFGDHKIWALK